MANQVAFSNTSIVNVSTDTPTDTTGTVTQINNGLRISPSSAVGYTYNYQTSGDVSLKSDSLLLELVNKSNTNEGNTRYNSNIKVVLIIQYYNEVTDTNGTLTGYESGDIAEYIILPYLQNENDGYISSYQLPLENKQIERIYVQFVNADETLIVDYLDVALRYSMTVTEAITQSVGFDIALAGIDWYPNGFQLAYEGTDSNDKFYWNGDSSDNLNGVDVNHVKLIYSRDHNEILE